MQTNYLRIHWTDFRDLCTKWKVFVLIWPIWTYFLSPQGMLQWQPVKVKKSAFFRTNLFCRTAIPKRIAISQFQFQKKINKINLSTMCTILVTFGPVTPEFTLWTIAPFAVIRQKSAYHVKYLRISWTYLGLLYRFGRRIGGDDYPNIRLAVAMATS